MDFFLSQVVFWACNFTPRAWGACQGALIAISTNSALFSLLGTNFGGDGRSTFGLPDLRGRSAIGWGTGPGLSPYPNVGIQGGKEYVTLSVAQMPQHNHGATFTASGGGGGVTVKNQYSTDKGIRQVPNAGDALAAGVSGTGLSARDVLSYGPANNLVEGNEMVVSGSATGGGTVTVANTGGSQSHENRSPFLTLNPCIVMQGLFPSRN